MKCKIYNMYKKKMFYYSSDNFIERNPWFEITLEQRFINQFNSNRFRNAVEDIQKKNFPMLFNHHVVTSDAFDLLLKKHQTKLTSAVATHLNTIDRAAETKVKEFVNNDIAFSEIKRDIKHATKLCTEQFLNDSAVTFKQTELDRNKRLDNVESELNSVKKGQWVTLFGGMVAGGLLTALAFK